LAPEHPAVAKRHSIAMAIAKMMTLRRIIWNHRPPQMVNIVYHENVRYFKEIPLYHESPTSRRRLVGGTQRPLPQPDDT
jgi:hypothetical protein